MQQCPLPTDQTGALLMTKKLPEKIAETSVPVAALIAARWSPRAIAPDQPVSKKQTTALLEAARWAPSCFGDQPWRVIVFDQSTDKEAWTKAFDCLAEGNQVWVKNAPVILAVVASSKFQHNAEHNRWAQYDTGAAAENLCLEATNQNLVAHQMGGFDGKALAASFSIPDDFTPMAMVAIGHPGTDGDLPEDLKEREQQPRERLDLGKIAFAGNWEQAWE